MGAVGLRVVIASSFVPFVKGGGRFIVDWLGDKLREYGHEVESFYLPFDERHETLMENLLSYRLIDLSDCADRLITIRPPAHTLRHPNKVVWFIHHLRGYYDLAHTEHRTAPATGTGRAIRKALEAHDSMGLSEARRVFANSTVVRDRLRRFNGVSSKVLYPPLIDQSRYFFAGQNDEVVSVCRLEPHKRQHLMVEAMRYVKSPVRLRVCGKSFDAAYESRLVQLAADLGVADRIGFQFGWISEAEKAAAINQCLASVYIPFDEDSYGYPTLEAASARKPTVTVRDGGGTLEFVRHRENGLVVDPNPQAIAEGFDDLFHNRRQARELGENAYKTIGDMNINWDFVIGQLLG